MENLGDRLIKEGIITESHVEMALERQKLHGGRLGENLIALGVITEKDLNAVFSSILIPPEKVEDIGLDIDFIAELVLKHSVFMGEFRISDMSERVKLPILVVEQILDILRRDKYVEIKGGSAYTSTAFAYKITDTGKNFASELLQNCHYVGPAPVPLDQYQETVRRQTDKSILIPEEEVKKGFSHLIVKDSVLDLIGPAISSGKAIFIYGPPGNGKTAIAETVGRLMPDKIFIPYAITVGGQIINIYDPANHTLVDAGHDSAPFDQRWAMVKRPVVMTGGELVMKRLDLEFNSISKYYEASLQMKANNGLLIVDDLGRQQIEPRHLLNRWTVPLDKGIDFMTLHTGMRFCIPFDMVIIFSTNIEPEQLIDEAFLRRIPYKIRIDRPNEAEFRSIFKLVCSLNGIDFQKEKLDYLISNYYKKLKINFNACHPRDLIDHIIIRSRYFHKKPELTRDNLDAAWSCYYVYLKGS